VAKGGGKVIIVKKVKKGGHGHHGGSWKVAYADFVTAMMAFFMVMWILGMDENTRKAIEGYFSNPIGFKKGYSSGSSPLSSGSSPAQVQRQAVQLALRTLQERQFEEVKKLLTGRMDSLYGKGLLNSKVEIAITNAGLRIELLESEQGNTWFDFGSASMKSQGRVALRIIADELKPLKTPWPSKDIPTRRSTRDATIPTGNCRPIAPTPPAAFWRTLVSARSALCRSTDWRTNS
jgi:chemotaxis protein MotB